MNVYIQLDVPQMLRGYIRIFRSSTGVLLIPQTIDSKYFLRVNTMPDKSWQDRGSPPTLRMLTEFRLDPRYRRRRCCVPQLWEALEARRF